MSRSTKVLPRPIAGGVCEAELHFAQPPLAGAGGGS